MHISTGRLLLGLFLCALTLRPQLVGAAPLFPIIATDQHLPHVVVGLLGTVPVLCMGLFAPLAPMVRARLGTVPAISVGVAMIGAFGVLRALVGGALPLVLLTFGIGAGMGIAGALLPVLVKEYFESHSLRASGIYSAGMQSGAALSAFLAVPIALHFGGWRIALLVFSMATLLLLVSWAALASTPDAERAVRPRSSRPSFGLHHPLAWRLALLFGLFGVSYYGLTAWLAASYVDRGWSLTAAGALVATLNVGSLMGAILLPIFAQRLGSRTRLATSLALIMLVGITAITVAPGTAFVAAFLTGAANGMLFPVVMAIPVQLTDRIDDVGAITGVMLGLGYTLAAIAPSGLGAVRDLTGSFVPVLGLIVLAAAGTVTLSVSFDAMRRHR